MTLFQSLQRRHKNNSIRLGFCFVSLLCWRAAATTLESTIVATNNAKRSSLRCCLKKGRRRQSINLGHPTFAFRSAPQDEEDDVWIQLDDDDDDEVTDMDDDWNPEKKMSRKKGPWRRRQLFSARHFTSGGEPRQQQEGHKKEKIEEEEEHPLRTDEWIVTLSPYAFNFDSKLFFPESYGRRKRRQQLVKFARNGYVSILEQQSTSFTNNGDRSTSKTDFQQQQQQLTTKHSSFNDKKMISRKVNNIGEWTMDSTGMSWTIPVLWNQKGDVVLLHYHADIHLNKFGSNPRMFRGVVTRDRLERSGSTNNKLLPTTWFRPVIATFTAEGIGKDTVDTIYRDRGFGLTKQHQQTSSSFIITQQ